MQTEKPAPSLDELEATLGARPVYASGGQIENFREGWAHNIMGSGKTAHYFRRNRFDYAVAFCGKGVEARWVYGAGNYPHCRICQKIADRRVRGITHKEMEMNRRIGRFVLSMKLIEHDPETARAVMGRVIVVRCEMMYYGTLEYIAISPDFDVVPEGTITPEYDVIISDGGKSVEFKQQE